MARGKSDNSGGRSVEEALRRGRDRGGSYDSFLIPDVVMYRAKEGENLVRILPRVRPGESLDPELKERWGDWWDIQVWVHNRVGPDNSTYLCLNKMRGDACPVCEARRQSTDQDEQDELKPQPRRLAWVIDRNNEKAGPQVWAVPLTMYREINTRSVDKKNNATVMIDDPDKGFDIMFTRDGTDIKTKYRAVEIDRDPSYVNENEDKQEDWLQYVIDDNPLHEILNFYEADYIEQVLYGSVGSGESGGSRRGRGRNRDEGKEDRRGSRGRSSREEPEEEEDTGRGSRRRSSSRDEPAEEEDRGRRGGRRSSREEPEEEEDKPATNRRRAGSSRKEEPDDEIPFEGSDRASKRRGHREEPEEEEPEESVERSSRSRRRASESDEETTKPATTRRRASVKEEPEEEEVEEEEDEPVGRARRQLDRLRNRGK